MGCGFGGVEVGCSKVMLGELGHGLMARIPMRWVIDSRQRWVGFDFGGRCGWCVVDRSPSRWLMGLTAIGLGWRFVDGLFMGLARFRVWWVVGCVWVQWWRSARSCVVVGMNRDKIVRGGSDGVCVAVEICGLRWVMVISGFASGWMIVVEWAWFLWERSENIFILF